MEEDIQMTWGKLNFADNGGSHIENFVVNFSLSDLYIHIPHIPVGHTPIRTIKLASSHLACLPYFWLTLVPSPNHMIPFNSLPAPALFLCSIFMDHSSLDNSPFSTQAQNLPYSHLAMYYIPSILLGPPLLFQSCDNWTMILFPSSVFILSNKITRSLQSGSMS